MQTLHQAVLKLQTMRLFLFVSRLKQLTTQALRPIMVQDGVFE